MLHSGFLQISYGFRWISCTWICIVNHFLHISGLEIIFCKISAGFCMALCRGAQRTHSRHQKRTFSYNSCPLTQKICRKFKKSYLLLSIPLLESYMESYMENLGHVGPGHDRAADIQLSISNSSVQQFVMARPVARPIARGCFIIFEYLFGPG